MIHIAVCDDSKEFRTSFDRMLRRFCGEIFPGTLSYALETDFRSGEEVLRYTETNSLDVLFLDIDMPDMDGLELAKRLTGSFPDLVIIFVSGYDHFVYDVFEFHPFAFLRKETLSCELPKTLKRLADKLDADSKRVALQTVDGVKTVSAKDVLYITSNKNYYDLHMKNGGVLSCRGTLKHASAVFLPFDFYQIHSAFLVNLDQISRFDKDGVYMGEENKRLPIAQRRLAGFRQAYARFTAKGV